jgi:uncharacterized membrane protein required for colicin V production
MAFVHVCFIFSFIVVAITNAHTLHPCTLLLANEQYVTYLHYISTVFRHEKLRIIGSYTIFYLHMLQLLVHFCILAYFSLLKTLISYQRYTIGG